MHAIYFQGDNFMTPFSIFYEDTHLMIVSKSSGLLSQGNGENEESLVDHIRSYLGRYYVGLVHRLDRNVSGLMVIGKRTKAARRLSQSLQSHRIIRHYNGIIKGRLETPQDWLDYLKKDERKNQVQVVSPSKGKEASMRVEPQKTFILKDQYYTLCHFALNTGRPHQIRIQCSHRDYPLLGDKKYGGLAHPHDLHRIALHAYYICIPHPKSGTSFSFTQNIPFDHFGLPEHLFKR